MIPPVARRLRHRMLLPRMPVSPVRPELLAGLVIVRQLPARLQERVGQQPQTVRSSRLDGATLQRPVDHLVEVVAPPPSGC